MEREEGRRRERKDRRYGDTEISRRITFATSEESSLTLGGKRMGPKTEARIGRVSLFSAE